MPGAMKPTGGSVGQQRHRQAPIAAQEHGQGDLWGSPVASYIELVEFAGAVTLGPGGRRFGSRRSPSHPTPLWV
jgi:hypothetical protein